MALYLFNISVDIPDSKRERITESLSYNDQESIVEFFIEKILGFDKAFPEYDDADSEEESSSSHGFNDIFSDQNIFFHCKEVFKKISKHDYHYTFKSTSTPYLDLASPPPDGFFFG